MSTFFPGKPLDHNPSHLLMAGVFYACPQAAPKVLADVLRDRFSPAFHHHGQGLTLKPVCVQLNATENMSLPMETNEKHTSSTDEVDTVPGIIQGVVAALYERLESIDRRLAAGKMDAPTTWAVDDIGEWLGLSKFTTSQSVVTRPGFPEPIVPSGGCGQKRWFADEVVEWFRVNRGKVPKGRAGSKQGRPRGRPRTVNLD